MKRYFRLFLQVIIAYLLFSILGQYLSDTVLIIVLIAVIVVFVLYGNRVRESNLYYLDTTCDVEKYLEYINKKLKDKDQSKYILYLSYGNLYNGDFKSIESDINSIDISKLELKEKLMYEEIQLKLLYKDKEVEAYEEKLKQMIEGEFNNKFSNELLVLKAPLLLMKEEYTELVDLMFQLIPKQRRSYRVIELEYYLSLAYVALNKKEDAIAVLEYVTKRDFKLEQVVKGRELLDSLKLD